MIEDKLDKVKRGRELVASGALKQLRDVTGISRNHLAGLLKSHGNHVRKWETGDVRWVHYASALRIAELHDSYVAADEWIKAEGTTWADLVPLRSAAMKLGIATVTLRWRMERNGIEAIDFDLLGEWITKEEAAQCRR